jgi:hypothetical protein
VQFERATSPLIYITHGHGKALEDSKVRIDELKIFGARRELRQKGLLQQIGEDDEARGGFSNVMVKDLKNSL